MNYKLLICLGLIFFSLTFVYISNLQGEKSPSVSSQIYQGPVPEGYDLEHFRATGETIKIGVSND